MTRFYQKRLAFEHEREVRAAFLALDEEPSEERGKLIPANIETLIASLVTSPYAPNWFEPVVKETVQKFGFSFTVNASALSSRGFRY